MTVGLDWVVFYVSVNTV